MEDGLCQAHALRIPFGEFAQKLVLDVRDETASADEVHALIQFGFGAGQTFQLAGGTQVFVGKPSRDRAAESRADSRCAFSLPRGCSKTSNRAAVAVPPKGEKKTGQFAHRGRFAGAVCANKADHLPLPDSKANPINGSGARVPPGRLLN